MIKFNAGLFNKICGNLCQLLITKEQARGGGGHSPYDLLRTRVKKKRRKGSVFRYTASKGVVDVSPEKGVFFFLSIAI